MPWSNEGQKCFGCKLLDLAKATFVITRCLAYLFMKIATITLLLVELAAAKRFYLIGSVSTSGQFTSTTYPTNTLSATLTTTRFTSTPTVSTRASSNTLASSTYPTAAPTGLTSYLFQWETLTNTSTDCISSPPEIVYGYQVSDPLKVEQQVDQVWPFFQSFWTPFYPIVSCNQKTPAQLGNKLCCLKIPNPSQVGDISSATQFDAQNISGNVVNYFPSVLNGANYCRFTNLGNYFAYNEMYIKPDGLCHEDLFKCYSNNTFAIYSDVDCTGDVNRSVITATSSSYFNFATDYFDAQMVTFRGAGGLIGHTYFIGNKSDDAYPVPMTNTATITDDGDLGTEISTPTQTSFGTKLHLIGIIQSGFLALLFL